MFLKQLLKDQNYRCQKGSWYWLSMS